LLEWQNKLDATVLKEIFVEVPDLAELFYEDVDEEFQETLGIPDNLCEESSPEDFIFARQCMEKFFDKREFYCGGPIPKKMLHSQRYAEILQLDISTAVNRIYDTIDVETDFDEAIAPETKLIISILDECSIMNIPKRYAGGITIAFLELCHGTRIG